MPRAQKGIGRQGKWHTSPAEEEEEEEEVQEKGGRGPKGQSSTAGMLPPNSSDEEEEEEVPKGKKGAGQSATAGMLPPNSDEEEESEEEDEPVQLTRKEREQLEAQKPEEPDPETITKDMERLAMIKEKRAKDAERRIANDGWDRMKPLAEDNHPPGMKWPPEGQ